MKFYELKKMQDGRLYFVSFEGTIKNDHPELIEKVQQEWRWLHSPNAYVELTDGNRYSGDPKTLLVSKNSVNEKITESYLEVIKQNEIRIANNKVTISETEFLIERLKAQLKVTLNGL